MITAIGLGLFTFALLFTIMWVGTISVCVALPTAAACGLVLGYYYHKSEFYV
jgi:membrane protease YdiL (CAAX protease family)